MVKAKGGPVPGYRDLDTHPENWISNLDVALDGGDKIGVGPVLEARDMANPNVEYLGKDKKTNGRNRQLLYFRK